MSRPWRSCCNWLVPSPLHTGDTAQGEMGVEKGSYMKTTGDESAAVTWKSHSKRPNALAFFVNERQILLSSYKSYKELNTWYYWSLQQLWPAHPFLLLAEKWDFCAQVKVTCTIAKSISLTWIFIFASDVVWTGGVRRRLGLSFHPVVLQDTLFRSSGNYSEEIWLAWWCQRVLLGGSFGGKWRYNIFYLYYWFMLQDF